jgi:transcriptional regulator with XRE-family HTH domain
MSASALRYCQCGQRLARDHAGALCSSCERQSATERSEPPLVQAGFWETAALRDACAAQHMGHVARAYRRHPDHAARYGRDGISQERLGAWLGLTQAQVSRIENGPPIRNLDTLAYWARILRIPADLLWFKLPPDTTGQDNEAPRTERSALPASRPFQVPPQAAAHLNDPDAVAMRAFRAADLQAGGGHMYASVIRYLQADMAPRLFGSDAGADDRPLFTAAAALTEMAGWMAHDSGRDTAASRHFGRALALVQVGGDQQLSAHVLGSMSHLASHLGQADEAIAFARQGQAALCMEPAVPGLQARMLALEARGIAAKGQASRAECSSLLLRAEKALDDVSAEPVSPWVSHFDAGSLASEAARCMRQVGDLQQARQQAERVIVLRPGNRARSRAFGQLALASILVAQGEPDHACGIADDVLRATASLGSYLVVAQLLQLQQQLQPYRDNAAVAEFLDCLQDTVRDRLPFYQLIAKDHHGQHRGGEAL